MHFVESLVAKRRTLLHFLRAMRKKGDMYEPLVESSIHSVDFSTLPDEAGEKKKEEGYTVNW